MQRDRPLPTLRVEVGPTKGAACRTRCDPLATLAAIRGRHNSADSAKSSQSAKGLVRGSEERRRARPRSGLIEDGQRVASGVCRIRSGEAGC
jgi:hypothetical protein